MQHVVDLRIAQLTAKDFREQLRKIQEEDRRIRRAQARAEGRRLHLEMSEREAEALDSQRHEYLSDWSQQQQEAFKAEQGRLWSLIPEEFRAKAERLARGGF